MTDGGILSRALEQNWFWLLILAVTIVGTLFANALGLALGITIILPHLLYLPIIVAVYRFPRREVAIAIVLGMGFLYFSMVYFGLIFFTAPPLPTELLFIIGRTVVFLGIGGVVSYLTLHLREEEERYRILVERSPDAIFIHRHGVITYVNPAAMTLLGATTPADLTGKHLLNLVLPQYHGSLQARMRETDELGYGSPLEMVMTRLDGENVYVEAAGAIVYQQGLPFHQVVMRDITERKRAEERLRRLTADLRRSNEDLQRFAYVASHDLQEPLRTIVIFTQLIERRYTGKLDKDADEYIQFIVNAGKRMQTLIDDLLQFSRVATRGKELERISSEDALNTSLENLKAAIESNQATITRDPLPPVMADPVQLQMVFQNLISNAIKFRKKDVPPEVHIGARRLNGMVEFSVQDNGIGIEPEYFEKIFVIFQRLHGPEEYPGTGIGLAIVKRIIDRHGGKIWVESTPGVGSTFHFTIPAAD